MKIGMLTSGGDCQGLNAAMRGVAKTLYEQRDDIRLFGFKSGYRGLMKGEYRELEPADFSGVLTLGGTILGTSRMSFKDINKPANPDEPEGPSRLEAMVKSYREMDLDALVVLGGNGTHKSAYALSREGLNVVTLPKTIDNDLWGTEVTFGFQSAINVATSVIDGIHTTAEAHGRVFIIEVMGNKVGWLTLNAGLAGGADVILIPEIPYNLNSIKKVIDARTAKGKKFSIVAMAEGALSVQEAQMKKKEYKRYRANLPYPSISYKLAADLETMLDQEVRVTVPGHFQRGGQPAPYDRVLASRCGAKAAELILQGEFGRMVGIKGQQMIAVPLSEVAGRLKRVEPDDELVLQARRMGIYFGDE